MGHSKIKCLSGLLTNICCLTQKEPKTPFQPRPATRNAGYTLNEVSTLRVFVMNLSFAMTEGWLELAGWQYEGKGWLYPAQPSWPFRIQHPSLKSKRCFTKTRLASRKQALWHRNTAELIQDEAVSTEYRKKGFNILYSCNTESSTQSDHSFTMLSGDPKPYKEP